MFFQGDRMILRKKSPKMLSNPFLTKNYAFTFSVNKVVKQMEKLFSKKLPKSLQLPKRQKLVQSGHPALFESDENGRSGILVTHISLRWPSNLAFFH
jgi:hypothetical protein